MRQRGDLSHFLRAQIEIEDGGILRRPLDLAGAWNDCFFPMRTSTPSLRVFPRAMGL
jgi:hypothetical protein